MTEISHEKREELQKRLFKCDHVIVNAGAKALEHFSDPIAVLLEVIQTLAAHTKRLEEVTEERAERQVIGLVFKPGEVVAEVPGPVMESTTVYATEEKMAALRTMSKETGVPMAEYIRRGIDLVLEEIVKKMPKEEKTVANS